MDNQRLILFIALSLVGLMLMNAWEEDYGQKPVSSLNDTIQGTTGTEYNNIPEPIPFSAETTRAEPVAKDVPAVPVDATVPVTKQAGATSTTELPSTGRIRVRTELLEIELDTTGGDIRQAFLKQYPVDIKEPENSFELMTDRDALLFVAQSGFSMNTGEGPNHTAIYRADQASYQLMDGQDELKVHLYWDAPSGVQVTKTYTFHRGKYIIDVSHRIENKSAQDWQGSFYRQLQRANYGESGGSMVMPTYTGGVIYTPENLYEKIDYSDMEDENLALPNITGGWVAMMQHYFLSAWIPEEDAVNTFYTNQLGYKYYIGMISAPQTISSGAEKEFISQIYIGPKLQDDLEILATGLDLTVDYGFLTVIAKPLFWLLKVFHDLTGNWGWAVILLTMSIKLAFYKLSETSYRSMANMRKLQPRMKALKERHGDDKKAFQKSMMEMYKKEKINPLGGCLPIVVQIPVFIALYWVLLESVEMRQAPFILWIHDLSAQDPYFVLPILMGATMLIQQKLNPAPIDPVQAKVMMALPFVFTVFFLFFPAGLVLYWVVNNTLSIAQQWVITKRITEGTNK